MKYLKYLAAIVVVLILLFIAKGMLTPEVSYEKEVVVNKSAKESWAVMADTSVMSNWIKGFLRTEHVSGTANTVGAVSTTYIEERGKEMAMTETITAIKANEQMAMTFTMDFMDMDYEVLFSEANGKTTITSKSKSRGNGLFAKSLLSFMPAAMKKQEEENLNNLKKLIEENTKNYFPEPATPQLQKDNI